MDAEVAAAQHTFRARRGSVLRSAFGSAQPRYCERWLGVRKSELGRKDSTKVQFCSHSIPLPFLSRGVSLLHPSQSLSGLLWTSSTANGTFVLLGRGLMTQLCNSQWHNCAAGVRRRALQNCTCAAAARHQHCHGFAAHTNMARVRHGCSFQAMGNHEHSSMAKLVAFLGTSAGCLAAAALLKSHLPEPKQQSQQRADWDDGEGHLVGTLGMAACSCCCGGMDLWQAVL